MTTKLPNSSFRGFSLIELMVVMGLVAVLISVGLVGYQTMLPGMRIRGAAQEVKAFVDNARETARVSSTDVMVGIVMTTNSNVRAAQTMVYAKAIMDESNGSFSHWELAGNPYILPTGVFSDPTDRNGVMASGATNLIDLAGQNMTTMSNRVLIRGSVSNDVYFITFNKDGGITLPAGAEEQVYRIVIPLTVGSKLGTVPATSSSHILGVGNRTNLAQFIEIGVDQGRSRVVEVK